MCWAEQGAGAGVSSVLSSQGKSRKVAPPQHMGSSPNPLQGGKAFNVMSILFEKQTNQPTKTSKPHKYKCHHILMVKLSVAFFSVSFKKN